MDSRPEEPVTDLVIAVVGALMGGASALPSGLASTWPDDRWRSRRPRRVMGRSRAPACPRPRPPAAGSGRDPKRRGSWARSASLVVSVSTTSGLIPGAEISSSTVRLIRRCAQRADDMTIASDPRSGLGRQPHPRHPLSHRSVDPLGCLLLNPEGNAGRTTQREVGDPKAGTLSQFQVERGALLPRTWVDLSGRRSDSAATCGLLTKVSQRTASYVG